VVGYGMLLAVTLAISDLPATAGAANPFIAILTGALGDRLGNALVWVVMGAMWFCGLSSITSNSRMLFAFARDGGLPGSEQVAKVSERFRSPHVAVWVSAVAAFAVALWAQAYSAMVALSTIALDASYAVPIALGAWARRTGRWTQYGPWDLGRWSPVVNTVALAWVAVLTVLFVLPPNELAGYTFAGFLALLAVYWFGYMRSRFRGPKVTLATAASGAAEPRATAPGSGA
jgi:amino acid transporter